MSLARSFLSELLSNSLLQQVAPLLAVVLIPVFVLSLVKHFDPLASSVLFMLSSLSAALPWNWGNSHSPPRSQPERPKKKKPLRTRADQLLANGDAKPEKTLESSEDGSYDYYPGLVNVSGTYCFMNSTMQALASLSYLQPRIDSIHDKAEALDVPTPVVDALQELLHTLNTPKSYSSPIRPIRMIDALSNHEPGKKSPLFSSREHQDAQELFQLVSECIKKETSAVDNEGLRDRGLGGLSQNLPATARELGKNVFDGLTANRRSCVECGYTEAVMHFAFDSWQLNLPRMATNCNIEDCLADYTRLELLMDCICRKCSMLATLCRLRQDAERLTEAAKADENASSSKKKRAREARKLEANVKAALEEERIEDDIKGVKMERVYSKASTKQAMIARPPPVLALHLNRSMHYGNYATKNTCRVDFPELLDLTPYTTSGKLSTSPSVPISSPPPPIPRSSTPIPSMFSTQRVIYRLSALVCHYGQHSFGHYVCYRRKPRPLSAGASRFNPPKMPHYPQCDCETCTKYGPVRESDEDDEQILASARPGRGWLRISDDSVSECGIESVLQEGSAAFMLYYERVVQPRPHIYPLGSPKGSEDTVKPKANGSTTSMVTLASGDTAMPCEAPNAATPERTFGARVIRSVEAGRSWSSGVSTRESSSSPRTSSNSVLRAQTRDSSLQVDGVKGKVPLTKTPKIEIIPALQPDASPSPDLASPPSLSEPPIHSPSPSPARRPPPQHRIQSPQSIRTRQISPARTVGLRA